MSVALKPSFYNHYTAANEPGQTILFNKFWGSISVVADATASALRLKEFGTIEEAEATQLFDAGFLVPADTDEVALARERYVHNKANNSVLSLTIELTQACNLACGYCYQNDYRDSGSITVDTVAGLQQYIRNVLGEKKRPITDVVLRFIGGEPLLQKAKVIEAAKETARIVAELGASFHTQIDTNGLLLDAEVVQLMDTISISITNKADHDAARPRHNGKGSYDQILKRLRRHADAFNEFGTLLSIRYNANALNAKYAPEVYRMIKGLGIEQTEFELYNTVNYDYNALTITLSRQDFKRLYMEIVRLKLEHGEVIGEFPRPTFAPCSAYTPYNLKVTANGQLAACDAFHTPVSSLTELLEDTDRHLTIFEAQAQHNPFDHPRCGGCTNIGICGGEYFCKTNPHVADNNPCDFLPFDMDEFLRFFADNYGKAPELFKLGGQGD